MLLAQAIRAPRRSASAELPATCTLALVVKIFAESCRVHAARSLGALPMWGEPQLPSADKHLCSSRWVAPVLWKRSLTLTLSLNVKGEHNYLCAQLSGHQCDCCHSAEQDEHCQQGILHAPALQPRLVLI